jgi:hypothetical protein
MSRTPQLLVAALLAATCLAAPGVARAQDDLLPPKVLIRQFPQGTFCALPISLSFTAPVQPVIVTFTALEWVDDGSNGLQWTNQLLDNITVSPTAQVLPNYLPPPAGSSAEFCYIGDPLPTPYFRFNRAGLELDLLERFDSDPTARGWLMNNGAFFVGNQTAARDVESLTDFTGGSLGLGAGTGTPVAGHTASTSWWYAGFVKFPHDVTYLTVTITTLAGVPVAKRSWGALKGDYR